MPLISRVNFQAVLQKGNRFQIPKLIQWQFKMEQNQVLKVGISPQRFIVGWNYFYAKMDKQGRMLIPKLTLAMIADEKNPNLAGYVFNVWLEPS